MVDSYYLNSNGANVWFCSCGKCYYTNSTLADLCCLESEISSDYFNVLRVY